MLGSRFKISKFQVKLNSTDSIEHAVSGTPAGNYIFKDDTRNTRARWKYVQS